MGLDMYLYAEKYVGGWKHNRESRGPKARSEVSLFDKLTTLTGITPTPDAPSFQLKATVGCWRKANAIHRWFVENVQDGVDECQNSYVEREQLAELRDACRKVLDSIETVPGKVGEGRTYYSDGRVEHHTRDGEVVAQVGIAAAVLPTTAGFFFGKTDYDEDYLSDLRDTVKIIDDALNNPALADCTFYYHASW